MKELYDKDMREALFSYFEDNYGKIRFLEEFRMGKSRADAVMISEQGLTGFELKSDKDSLVRLKRQMKDYDKFYDYNYIVVGHHYEQKIADVVPEYWGIIKVFENDNEKIEVEVIRESKINDAKVLRNQLTFLWREELIKIIRAYKLGAVSGKNKSKLSTAIYSKLDEQTVRKELVYALMEREYPKIYYFYYKTPDGVPIDEITFVTDGECIEYLSLSKVRTNYIYSEDLNLHRQIKKQFDEYFNGNRYEFELPLKKLRCSSFSRKVYEGINEIPYGETATFIEIATKADRPEGFRSVTTVCNKNLYPIIIPCHRVVGKKGAITSYSGGKEMKIYLLNLEKENLKSISN